LKHDSEGPNKINAHKAIKNIIENIDKYIGDDFRREKVKTIIADEKPLKTMPTEQIISYQRFCLAVFRAKFENQLNNFIKRYISILPEDLRMNIYSMENSINAFVFITMMELTGQEIEMSTNEYDQKELKRNLLIMGECLIEIYDLIEDKQ